MTDEWGVGGPDRRSSTDVNHAVGVAGNHVCRLLARAHRDDGAVLVGKSRDGAIGPGPEQDDVAARQLEETLDVRGVFRGPSRLPTACARSGRAARADRWRTWPVYRASLRLAALLPAAKQRDELAPSHVEHGLPSGTRRASLPHHRLRPKPPAVLRLDLNRSERISTVHPTVRVALQGRGAGRKNPRS
jgi:hypothetical protein